jgi:hypothetical protein
LKCIELNAPLGLSLAFSRTETAGQEPAEGGVRFAASCNFQMIITLDHR